MTVTEIFAQARALSPQERKELAKLLIDSLDTDENPGKAKTGAEIVVLLQTMNPIEFIDSHIEDLLNGSSISDKSARIVSSHIRMKTKHDSNSGYNGDFAFIPQLFARHPMA
jgi:hypothetical protein